MDFLTESVCAGCTTQWWHVLTFLPLLVAAVVCLGKIVR